MRSLALMLLLCGCSENNLGSFLDPVDGPESGDSGADTASNGLVRDPGGTLPGGGGDPVDESDTGPGSGPDTGTWDTDSDTGAPDTGLPGGSDTGTDSDTGWDTAWDTGWDTADTGYPDTDTGTGTDTGADTGWDTGWDTADTGYPDTDTDTGWWWDTGDTGFDFDTGDGQWICTTAANIDGFLDQFQTPGDGMVWYCHATSGTNYNLQNSSVSSCLTHISHPGDVFPSTICDS